MRFATAVVWVILAACRSSGAPPAPPPPEEPETAPQPPPRLEGQTLALTLAEPSHSAPEGAAHAMVRVADGFEVDAPWTLVVFLHGWNGCARVLMRSGPVACLADDDPEPGWGLEEPFDRAGANAILLMPQLAFRAREGSAGRFDEPDFAGRLVAEVAASVEVWPDRPPERVVVVAHSAGFESALAWLRQDAIPVHGVVLMDALYAGTERFAEWAGAAPGRRLVSITTGRGSTARQSRRLRRLAERADIEVGELDSSSPVVILTTDAPHRDVPAEHLTETLRHLAGRATRW